jgi:hypothetical protein
MPETNSAMEMDNHDTKNEEPKLQCCFCGESIRSGNRREHPLDPCSIILIGHWHWPRREQSTQQFFCHLECFREAIDGNAPLYIADLAE